MASKNKKTTFAKLSREAKLREKRVEKRQRKDARKLAAAEEADRIAAGGDPYAPPEAEGDQEPQPSE